MPFIKPNSQKKPTPHLFLSHCGPRYGVTPETIRELLQPFCSDPSQLVLQAPQPHFWVVTFPGPQGADEAAAVVKALSNQPFEPAGGRTIGCKFARWVPEGDGREEEAQQPCHPPVACTTEEANIPGMYLLHDFITEQQEQQLLAAIDQQPWMQLSKRRVQHYGYRFEYTTRGVDLKEKAGAIPHWAQQVVQQVQELPGVPVIDQVTVNEYTPGVGIAPHVDAHSSFTGSVLSLSLSGSCCMVFKKAYVATAHGASHVITGSSSSSDDGCAEQAWQEQWKGQDREVVVFLPPRSLVVMSGEARYAWQHYIPHRKSDWVNGQQVPRSERRVSLTLRKVRGYPCDCTYPKYCDSQEGILPPPASFQQQQQQQGAEQHDANLADNTQDEEQQQGMQQQPKQQPWPPQHGMLQEQQSGQQQEQQHQPPQQQQHQPPPPQQQHQPQQQQQQQHQPPQQQVQQHQVQQPGLCVADRHAANGKADSEQAHANGHHQPLAVAPDAMPNAGEAAGAAAGPEAAATGGQSYQALEDTHVHQVYDVIAGHFSSTRFAVWPKVRAFLESLPPGSVVADVGCGNGKYLGVRPDLAVLGCDRSAGLAAVAAQRLAAGSKAPLTGMGLAPAAAADVFVCDALQLCYRHCSCDAVLCIAVLHHISSRQRRLALLQQLAAVLRCGGRGIVTVWATEQEDPAKTIQRWHRIQPAASQECGQEEGQDCQQQGAASAAVAGQEHSPEEGERKATKQQQQQQAGGVVEGPDYFVPWHLPFHKAGGLAAAAQQQAAVAVAGGSCEGSSSSGGSSTAGPSGLAIDAAKGAVVLQRYYHLFEQGELEGLVAEVPGLEVVQVFYDRSNWCVEFLKQA